MHGDKSFLGSQGVAVHFYVSAVSAAAAEAPQTPSCIISSDRKND